jgi:hypothetical protein
MKFGLATGNLYRVFKQKDQNKIIELFIPLYEKYCLNAIELTYSSLEDMKISLSKKSINFLNNLDFVSIHYPFKIKLNKDAEKVIESLSKTYHSIQAQHIIVHPELIEDIFMIKYFEDKYNLTIVTELQDKKRISLMEFEELLQQIKLPMIYDVGHAESYSQEEFCEIIKKYPSFFVEVHLNKRVEDKAHRCFFDKGIPEQLSSILKLKNLAWIIEEDFKLEEMDRLEKEILFLKGVFKNILEKNVMEAGCQL